MFSFQVLSQLQYGAGKAAQEIGIAPNSAMAKGGLNYNKHLVLWMLRESLT